MAGASAGDPPGPDPSAIVYVTPKRGDVLEVDIIDPLLAELTNLLSRWASASAVAASVVLAVAIGAPLAFAASSFRAL